MAEEFKRERTYKLTDPDTGEVVELTRLPTGNFKIIMNSGGELKPDIFEALIEDMQNILEC